MNIQYEDSALVIMVMAYVTFAVITGNLWLIPAALAAFTLYAIGVYVYLAFLIAKGLIWFFKGLVTHDWRWN